MQNENNVMDCAISCSCSCCDCQDFDKNPQPEIKNINVVAWVSYRKVEEDLNASVGSMGGWFTGGMRWKDYIEDIDVEMKPYVVAIFEDIKISNRKISGMDHISKEDGTPLFSDGKYGSWTQRGWSDLMAAIWSEIENKDFSYLDFYNI